MSRIAWTFLVFLMPATAFAADVPPAGVWKVGIYQEGVTQSGWIVELKSKDDQWTATIVATHPEFPKAKVENLQVAGDIIRFNFKIENQNLAFEGKIPKEKGKLLGSFASGQGMTPGQLEATTLRSFDPTEIAKDILASQPDSPAVFEAARDLLQDATKSKAKPEEVRGWADKAFKAAAAFGPRWQREIALRITQSLSRQDAYAAIAVEYGRRTERLLEPTDDAALQIRVLESLVTALRKSNKAEEAKEFEARLDKLEAKADQEYLKKMPPFQPDPYHGRKNKSDRVVLFELFTGAQCPPCVAADLAFDGLTKTYKPEEVVLLQYHVHVPGPDPLTNPDTEARWKYYSSEAEGTPWSFLDGASKAQGGGGVDVSKDRYFDYRDAINPLLEKAARAKLQLSATRQGDKIDIQSEVSDLEKTGEKVRLRFALVEDQVRYVGGNQVRFHHHVVRAMPGSSAGFPLKEKAAKQSASVNLSELRQSLTTYLDEFGKSHAFPNSRRPLDLKNLRVVAFIQDDQTKEVLQAAQVDVKGQGGEAEIK
ncbi:MAG TPA: hypothetical protein VGX70_01070 [Gemmataceae bacterium]|nr:hypothetical protein [Gemmataceae bacterium]